jgi:hypothetical protein
MGNRLDIRSNNCLLYLIVIHEFAIVTNDPGRPDHVSDNCHCEQKRDVLPRFCVAIFFIVVKCERIAATQRENHPTGSRNDSCLGGDCPANDRDGQQRSHACVSLIIID